MRVAVSGHRGLTTETVQLVDRALRETLSSLGTDIVGLSCLADGADQIFAEAVLAVGGQLEAVIPAKKYRDGLPDDTKATYDKLMSKAEQVHQLDFVESTSESHQAASEYMVDSADQLIAVWDGLPARGYGGTADVVAYAREQGKPVMIVWPEGSARN